MSYVYNIPR